MKGMAVSSVSLRHEGAGGGVHDDPASPPVAASLTPAQGPSHEDLLEAPVLCAPQIVGPGHWNKQNNSRYQCCGSGSGIRCLFDPWIRDG
jgi:hypothetical protein